MEKTEAFFVWEEKWKRFLQGGKTETILQGEKIFSAKNFTAKKPAFGKYGQKCEQLIVSANPHKNAVWRWTQNKETCAFSEISVFLYKRPKFFVAKMLL
jgi:hypothetical protein